MMKSSWFWWGAGTGFVGVFALRWVLAQMGVAVPFLRDATTLTPWTAAALSQGVNAGRPIAATIA